MKDLQIIKKFRKEKPWGMSMSVDLYGCNPETIRSSEKIKQYVLELCELIKMKRFGETQVVNFGEDPRVCGYSMTQLIETSLISGHFANELNAAYIDLFSCKDYPPQVVIDFSKSFFEAKDVKYNITFRY